MKERKLNCKKADYNLNLFYHFGTSESGYINFKKNGLRKIIKQVVFFTVL